MRAGYRDHRLPLGSRPRNRSVLEKTTRNGYSLDEHPMPNDSESGDRNRRCGHRANLCPSVDLIDRRSQSLSATLVDITFFLPGSRFHNSYGTSLFDPYGWPLRPPWSRGRKPVSGCGHEIDVGCVLLESAARLESALDQTRAESRTQFLDVMDSPRPCP
jgi:hypothetical protein